VRVEAISKFREGIAAKFALIFSLLVLVATGTVGYMVYRGAEQSLIDASSDHLEHTADVIKVRLSASVEAISKDLRFLAATPPVQGIVRAHVDGVRVDDMRRQRAYIDPETNIDDREWRDQLANTLTVFLENRPSYVHASFIGRTRQGGRELVRIDKRDRRVHRTPAAALQPVSEDSLFHAATQLPKGAFHLSDITMTRQAAGSPPVPTLRAITPVYARNGHVYGCISIEVDARPMLDAFDSLLDPDFTLHLANEKGQLLTHARADTTFGDQFPGAAAWFDRRFAAPLRTELGEDEAPARMAYFERVAFGMPPNQHHLMVGVTSPYETMLARVARVRDYSLLITLLFGLIGIALALVFSGYLTYPLRQVTQALSRFGREGNDPGDAERLPTHRKDEIGVLARTFHAMTQQIKQQLHELADKERRQRIILETSAEGIIVVTDEGLIETFNQTAEDLFGHTAAAMEGTTINRVLLVREEAEAADDPHWLPPWKQVGSGREVTGVRADGALFPLSLAVSAFELFGEQKYAIFLQDISKRKRYERILQEAKEKAEEVARLKSTFLANMSHEIRTPLTTVIGYAGVLAEEVSDRHREFAQFIRNSGERLMETLNSVLSLAQLEASGVEIQFDVLEVVAETREIVDLFRPLADENGLELRFVPPDDEPLAHLDRGALSSVMQNLIGNAIKFTEAGRVTVRITLDEQDVHLHVEDTGIGIDADFLPHLFDEFVQESTGVRRSHEGSGLGLAITKRLVDLMNGRIQVESTKGEGTVFTVSFPRTETPFHGGEGAPSGTRTAIPGGARSAPAELLLAEDNIETARMMEELLRETCNVTAVSDGEMALRHAQETAYDIVLLDINLGGGPSGADVLRRLRAQPAYENVPIAAVTAYALPGDRERLLKMGFDAYLDKPFAPEDLDELMEQLLAVAQPGGRSPRKALPRARPNAGSNLTAPGDRP